MSKTVLFLTIQFSISTQLQWQKTVLFQIIQFRIITQFSSIRPIDRALSGATTPGQSGPGSDSNERVLRISQSSSITRTSPSDCLVSYPGHSFAEEWVLALCREAVRVFYSPSKLDNRKSWKLKSDTSKIHQIATRRNWSSYNPFSRVASITIWATARIAINTIRFT